MLLDYERPTFTSLGNHDWRLNPYAPFVKGEATKFTEVGYVGRDVESIIRDLVENAISVLREEQRLRVEARARDAAEERLLAVLDRILYSLD